MVLPEPVRSQSEVTLILDFVRTGHADADNGDRWLCHRPILSRSDDLRFGQEKLIIKVLEKRARLSGRMEAFA